MREHEPVVDALSHAAAPRSVPVDDPPQATAVEPTPLLSEAPISADHARRLPVRFTSRVVTMTLLGASLLFSSGAVLGANHAPAQGGPLTEASARASIDSLRYASTRSLVDSLSEANAAYSELESQRRTTEEHLRWYRDSAPADQKREAVEVVARDRKKLDALGEEIDRARARVKVAESALAPWIREAARSLEARGLPTELRNASPHQLIDAAAVAEAWINRNGSLPSRTDAIHWLLFGGDTQAILKALAEQPRPLFSDPMELSAAGAFDPVGWQRAESLRDRYAYSPDARDLEGLAALDSTAFDRLLSLFDLLARDASFSLTDEIRAARFGNGWSSTDVETLSELVVPDELGRHGFWLDSPSELFSQRPTFALADFAAAAALLAERGIPFRADHTALAALLASDLDLEKRAALFLLDQLALTGALGETEQLARAARRGGQEGSAMDAASFATIREATSRMGRPLSVGEASSLLSSTLTLDALIPRDAVRVALAIDPSATLQDVALFSAGVPVGRSPPSHLRSLRAPLADREALLGRIERRITAGVPRHDRSAEYSESWTDAKTSLSRADLVRLDLLLDFFRSREGRAAMAKAVARDLAQPDAEVGGRIDLAGGRVSLALVASAPTNNNSYVYPEDAAPLLRALVPFHLHAIEASGNPHSAGPSSAYGGRTGDRGASRNRGLAEVVITHLNHDRFGVDFYTPSGAVVDLGTFAYAK